MGLELLLDDLLGVLPPVDTVTTLRKVAKSTQRQELETHLIPKLEANEALVCMQRPLGLRQAASLQACLFRAARRHRASRPEHLPSWIRCLGVMICRRYFSETAWLPMPRIGCSHAESGETSARELHVAAQRCLLQHLTSRPLLKPWAIISSGANQT